MGMKGDDDAIAKVDAWRGVRRRKELLSREIVLPGLEYDARES